MAIKCLNDITPIGERCEQRNNFAQINSIFLCKPGFSFATASAFATEANWHAAIIAENIIPIHGILEVESTNTDDLKYQSPTGEQVFNGDGLRGKRIKLLYDLKTHQTLRSYSGKNWGIIEADRNRNIKATSADGTVIKPLALQYFQVSMQGEAVGADQPAWTIIEYQFADVNEWDTDGVYLNNPTFLPTQLTGVGHVVLTQVGSIAANAYVVDVKYVDDVKLNGQSSGADSVAAISGAVDANFQTLNGSGVVVAITSVVESAVVPGRYTVTHAAFTAGTSQFIASATLKYESDALTLV